MPAAHGLVAGENQIGGMATETLGSTTLLASVTLAGDGVVVPGIVPSGKPMVVEAGKLTEDPASMTMPTTIGANGILDCTLSPVFAPHSMCYLYENVACYLFIGSARRLSGSDIRGRCLF